MEQEHYLQSNMRRWHRRVANTYWIALIVYIAANLISVPFLDNPSGEFLTLNILIGLPALLLLLLAAEWTIRHTNRYTSYSLMFLGTLMASFIVWSNYVIASIPSLFLLPLIISAVFFNRRLTFFTLALILIQYLLIYHFKLSHTNSTVPELDLIGNLALFLMAAIISGYIFKRGGEIIQILRNLDELRYENFVKDNMTKRDGLTGLHNYRSYNLHIKDLFENHLIPERVHACSLGIIDIDNFKTINDSYGHLAGDQVLRRVAEIIQRHCEGMDFAARYGGEEFVVIFHGNRESVRQKIESIRQQVEYTTIPDMDQSLTVSIGLQAYQPTFTCEQWFREADALLYQAKHSGKNKIVQQ